MFDADAHAVAVATREEAARALFDADAHGVAVAAHYEAARALINADAHGGAGQPVMRLRERCLKQTIQLSDR